MQTNFSAKQLKNPRMAEAEKILRRCVHCGFCTATCPTYLLLGDERDSPRGRIYLMKEMFENERKASPEVQRHVDRCLSCLSCMTTCPSGVDYMHLVDHARVHIEETGQRSLKERALRAMLAADAALPGPLSLGPARGAALPNRWPVFCVGSGSANWRRCWSWHPSACCAVPPLPGPEPPSPSSSAANA